MATKKTAKKAQPAGQNSAGKNDAKPVLRPCKVVHHGMLYNECHHAKGKLMSIPEADALALAKQGAVAILPGLG